MEVIDYTAYEAFYLIYQQETGDFLPERPAKPDVEWWKAFFKWKENYHRWLNMQGINWRGAPE